MIDTLRNYIEQNNLDAMLVNSTNEFLVEYNTLEENSRYLLTGFTGSTGDAVVTKDEVYLFVDGRYHIQADEEVDHSLVTVVKLQSGETFLNKLRELIPEGESLGVVAAKNSQERIENLGKYFNVRLLALDPVQNNIKSSTEKIEDIPLNLCGKTSEDKIKSINDNIGLDDAILVTNQEDVSYLFNLRDFSQPYSSKIFKRAIVTRAGSMLFGKDDFEKYKETLLSIKGKVYVDKSTINGRDFLIVNDKAEILEKNPVQWMRAIKTDAEINHYIEAFRKTDMAVKAIRSFIENNDNISEYDIDRRLEEEFIRYGAKGLSFKSIVAKDVNSASAHYSKSSKGEIVKDGSLVLIDCGAYYEGGLATDITRVFVKGEPSVLQKRVYTTVLKAFLKAFNTKIVPGISGFDIDAGVRQFFAENPIDGFVFNHGLGHGIGISVHEYPPNLSCNEAAKVPLSENMCFTIEPGLYNKNHFGVRLENSCYLKNGRINSFVNMNYEKKLIDYNLLSEEEKQWLADFEVI